MGTFDKRGHEVKRENAQSGFTQRAAPGCTLPAHIPLPELRRRSIETEPEWQRNCWQIVLHTSTPMPSQPKGFLSAQDVAQLNGRTKQWVHLVLREYTEMGKKAFRKRFTRRMRPRDTEMPRDSRRTKKKRGRPYALEKADQDRLKKRIQSAPASGGKSWTPERVRIHIKDWHGLDVSYDTARRILHKALPGWKQIKRDPDDYLKKSLSPEQPLLFGGDEAER